MNIAMILAGGTGSRIGAAIPKQFITILGQPIIAYTLRKYDESPQIDAIEIVCHPDYLDEVKTIVSDNGFNKVKWYAKGGKTFQDSTINGVFNLRDKIDDNDIVLITGANSPLVTDEIISDSLAICKMHGNAVAADEMVMCTGIKDDQCSTSTSISRETIVGFNFPWSFTYGELRDAYETVLSKGVLSEIDPHTSSLYLFLGKKLWFAKSSTSNIKITTPEDLDLFEGMLLLEKSKTH